MSRTIKAGITIAIMASLGACATSETVSSVSSTLDTVTPDVTLNRFVDTRIASIQKEAAAGEGENLDALAELMGESDREAFSRSLQTNYDELFSNLEQPSDLIARLETI